MRISVVGLGKLGSPFLAVCAEKGFEVIGIEKNKDFVRLINKGISPVNELQTSDLLKKNLQKIKATTNYVDAIVKTDVTFIVVSTPSNKDGSFSTQFLTSVAKDIAQILKFKNHYHLIVINSTITPGTTEQEIIPILESVSGKKCGKDFGVCYNPLFIALGSVIQNILNPDFVLIGETNLRSGDMLEEFYKGILDNNAPIRRMNIINAELVKISLNAYITTKISFANTLSQICENLPNTNVDIITTTLGLDSRIGSKYLKAGLGYGGPCFPRDNAAFNFTAKKSLAPSPLAEATDLINQEQINRLLHRLTLSDHNISKVAVLGLTYKTNTPVTEKSQGLEITERLVDLGKSVYAYDPLLNPQITKKKTTKFTMTSSVEECIDNADAIIITLPYEEFKLNVSQIEKANLPVVYDMWRILKPNLLRGKATYLAVGLPENSLNNLNALRKQKVVICGAGGFIGGHLVADLIRKGYNNIRAVDIKSLKEWSQLFPQVENLQLDLRDNKSCEKVLKKADFVYNLASDMGGMGFIENNKALCMLNVLINTHLLQMAVKNGVKRYFFSSSACVYPQDKQSRYDVTPLKELDAYPADPEDGYGWEKLFSERMCRHFREDFGLETRVARFHNVYGPFNTYGGDREKAPAAIIRKVIETKASGNKTIEIWGDGNQARSFVYIEDCIKGIQEIMLSDYAEPINVGSSKKITINQLVDIIEEIAGVKLEREYNLDAPKGVNGRNSDNTLIKSCFGWEPATSLKAGLEKTYSWIYEQMVKVYPKPTKHKLHTNGIQNNNRKGSRLVSRKLEKTSSNLEKIRPNRDNDLLGMSRLD